MVAESLIVTPPSNFSEGCAEAPERASRAPLEHFRFLSPRSPPKNSALAAAIRRAGYRTVSALARDFYGPDVSRRREIDELLAGARSPLVKDGRGWRKIVKELCEFLGEIPEDLFVERPIGAELSPAARAAADAARRSAEGVEPEAVLRRGMEQVFSAAKLNYAQRMVLRARYWEGLTMEEIAAQYQTSEDDWPHRVPRQTVQYVEQSALRAVAAKMMRAGWEAETEEWRKKSRRMIGGGDE